jgi:hypothetical protein
MPKLGLFNHITSKNLIPPTSPPPPKKISYLVQIDPVYVRGVCKMGDRLSADAAVLCIDTYICTVQYSNNISVTFLRPDSVHLRLVGLQMTSKRPSL